MERSRLTGLSKRMSLALRHDPGKFGLTLDEAGWVAVPAFLTALRLDRDVFDTIVETSDKQRFAVVVGPDGVERVRANQGHSVPVELGLEPATAPGVLFHGTSAAVLPSIRAEGLIKGKRHHVHLSPDRETAQRVGARRRGAVAILEIDAPAMEKDGHTFYRSANNVWLVDAVPPKYLRES
ncbi:RNA 2'-phosphotransferase [Cryptosporangium phraense]|uniref:Probable RNA 2'-phosphotransferase n=1 Tax=Cryptosporangium phraense TaxID=2593070 RepID=A0A545AI96_9ACTN|nr:RNA 2'-phosphotransferase [Cryptosporangium phraense]TQS41042.1 RNA 2'-phosphotransferase [Cryptosporangium phraense]